MQGEFLREGLWGEQVQGEGRRNRRAKPGPRGSAAGSAPLRGARLRRRFLRLAEVCEGAGARPWGAGGLRFAGACEGAGVGAAATAPAGRRAGRSPAAPQGRLPPRPAPAAGLPVNRGLDYRRRRGYNRGEVKMMNDHYLMISFENTHSAIRTERLLEQHFKVATMPTLRTVTQSCGISLRLAAEDYEPARKMVAESGLSPQMYAIYLVDSNKNVLELSK